jgi:peptidoglycan/xylan/chitin deacetylase (PgdA/CDA1 family)
VVAPPPPDQPVLARNASYAVVVVQPGETLATLAERWLGDRNRRDAIARFNRVDEARPGQVVAIPLAPLPPTGLDASGLQAVTILCYHRFGARASNLTVTPAAFEAQMAFLARHGYSVIPLSRLPAFLEGRASLPPKPVIITIDDGYRSTFEVAFPVLKRHGFPATVFLYSDFVGAPDALTWAQMREMAQSGLIDIQPHSKSHANLTLRLPNETEARYRERTRREIDAPVDAIRERVGGGNLAFAFPYGDVNELVVAELAAQGIKLGLTVTPGGNPFYAPPAMLRRTMIFGGDDLDAFRGKLVTTLPVPRL